MAMELQRKTTENKYLIEIIKRFQSVIITSKLISDSKVIKSLNEFGRASLEKTTAVFEILVNKIVVLSTHSGKGSAHRSQGVQARRHKAPLLAAAERNRTTEEEERNLRCSVRRQVLHREQRVAHPRERELQDQPP